MKILSDNKFKNIIPPFMKKKLMLSMTIVALAFVTLAINLIFFVGKNRDEYERIVLSQRQSSYDSRTIAQKRGEIKDRNGLILAQSKNVYNLILDPHIMLSEDDERYSRETILAISEYFGESAYAINDLVNKRKSSSYVRLKKELSYEQKNGFEELTNERNDFFRKQGRKDRIKGVWFEEEYKRYYPYQSLLSNTIGFINESENAGLYGLESYYDDILSGTNGRRYGYLDNEYDLNTVEREPQDGSSLITTIDVNIQTIAEKYLKEWQEGDIGSKMASVIAMDPNTGEIYAMASTNSYDLNNPRDTSMYTEEEIASFGGKEQIWFSKWTNNCVSYTYEPGSTAKVFTVCGGLEENLVNSGSIFKCEGKMTLTDGVHSWTIRCINRQGHGEINLEESLMESCNMAMAEISKIEGANNFTKYQKIFGFGEKTNIDLPAEADTSNLIYQKGNLGRTALSTNSFGQNYNVTMVQMAAAYSSIINGGNYYVPHIVKRIEDANGKVIEEKTPTVSRKTCSENTCEFIKNALYRTVNEGTGKAAKIPGLEVAGKTGTAEKLPRADKNYLVSFMGFVPYENPKLLVYVIVDTPNLEGEAQAHSSFATEICRKIIEDSSKYINLKTEE